MAFRKETVKRQFADALAKVLEPGEVPGPGVFGISGPSPWLGQGALGLLGLLIFRVRPYYLAVTDRRVVALKGSHVSGRPAGLAWADPRTGGAVTEARVSAPLWSHFRYRRPGGRSLRLNVHRMWRAELEQFLAALGEPAG